jgi:hypothetical protein
MFDPRIAEIAHKTRAWAEKKANYGLFCRDLTGFCARGAAELHIRLRRAGFASQIGVFDPRLYEDSNACGGHAFVMVQEHVVDITATQFGLKPVEIVPFGPYRKDREFWHATFAFDRLKDFINHIQEWPPYQRPRHRKIPEFA